MKRNERSTNVNLKLKNFASLKQYAEDSIPIVDSKQAIKLYYDYLRKLQMGINTTKRRENYEMEFVYMYIYCVLLLERIPKHRSYEKESKRHMFYREHCTELMKDLELIQRFLKFEYEKKNNPVSNRVLYGDKEEMNNNNIENETQNIKNGTSGSKKQKSVEDGLNEFEKLEEELYSYNYNPNEQNTTTTSTTNTSEKRVLPPPPTVRVINPPQNINTTMPLNAKQNYTDEEKLNSIKNDSDDTKFVSGAKKLFGSIFSGIKTALSVDEKENKNK